MLTESSDDHDEAAKEHELQRKSHQHPTTFSMFNVWPAHVALPL